MGAYRDNAFSHASLVAYWALGETSGSSASDAKGAHHGTYTGGVVLNRPSLSPRESSPSALFDGVDDYVSVPDAAALDVTRFTIAALVRGDVFTGSSRSILWKRGAYGLRAGADRGVTAIRTSAAASVLANTAAGVLTVGKAHHVAATYDGANLKVYVDGVERASQPAAGNVDASLFALQLAREENAVGTHVNYWNGALDEVALFGAALSAAQIEELYRLALVSNPSLALMGVG